MQQPLFQFIEGGKLALVDGFEALSFLGQTVELRSNGLNDPAADQPVRRIGGQGGDVDDRKRLRLRQRWSEGFERRTKLTRSKRPPLRAIRAFNSRRLLGTQEPGNRMKIRLTRAAIDRRWRDVSAGDGIKKFDRIKFGEL